MLKAGAIYVVNLCASHRFSLALLLAPSSVVLFLFDCRQLLRVLLRFFFALGREWEENNRPLKKHGVDRLLFATYTLV